ncbi:MAG: hypothetical protein WC834_00365 [Eubacteriales bacterium]
MKLFKPINPLWFLIFIPFSITPLLVAINYFLMSIKQRGIVLLIVVLAAPGIESLIKPWVDSNSFTWVADGIWYVFSLILVLDQRKDYLKLTLDQ